jgi:hypothetical protein
MLKLDIVRNNTNNMDKKYIHYLTMTTITGCSHFEFGLWKHGIYG